ncbi:hypothetical protein [uncultured Ilyobacter sp.]|uniref:hypothetical protein n=1 Tax=uncultured Ilyobacter sp. TaxID=544433 RepID=UPI002AA8DE0D|nr:hypothetical protein [uncultured Ilyobacter sp.]
MKYFKIEENQISGFYDSEIHDITDDMVKISDKEWKELLDKQSTGYSLTCKKGKPFPMKLNLGESWNGKKLISNLIPLKKKLVQDITNYRDSLREASTVNYKGNLQRYRKSDLSDIDYYQGRLEKAQIKSQEIEDALALKEGRDAKKIILTMTWYFYNGTTAEMTIDDFNNLVELTDSPIEELYRKEAILKSMISNIESIEKLKNFNIATIWNTI